MECIVITSKGVVSETDGWWVVWNNETKTYETRHILKPTKPEHTWEEGIFTTEKEAEERIEFRITNNL